MAADRLPPLPSVDEGLCARALELATLSRDELNLARARVFYDLALWHRFEAHRERREALYLRGRASATAPSLSSSSR
jgi:hypothetical protein